MENRRKKHIIAKKRRESNRRFFFFILILISLSSIYFSYTFIGQRISLNNSNKELDSLILEREILNKEIEDLREQFDNKDTPEYIEKIARDKLGMIKPNEYIVKEYNEDKNKDN